jgi:hypothetical protein
MSHPLYSQRKFGLGEDYEQCRPKFPKTIDCGGTYLLQEEGQGSNREWPVQPVEIAVFWRAKVRIRRKMGRRDRRTWGRG